MAPAAKDPKPTTAPSTTSQPTEPAQPSKSAAALEEDDEFEDFPVDDWGVEETEAANADGAAGGGKDLWEESWDDDDTSDDFSQQLKEELKKVDAAKRR